MVTPSAAREGEDDGKVKLYLARPTPGALAELYKRLTGKPLSAEGLKQLREITREEHMSCEICGETEDLRSMQTTRPAPVVLCRACAYVAGTDPRTVLALVDALVNDPALAYLFPRRRREHHRGGNWHPAPAQMQIPGIEDERAAAALQGRATSGTEPKRTADEQSVLDTLVRVGGRPLTSEEEFLALEQARAIGNLE